MNTCYIWTVCIDFECRHETDVEQLLLVFSLQLAAKRGLLGESSFQRLNLALLFASAFNVILFLQNAATGGQFFKGLQ